MRGPSLPTRPEERGWHRPLHWMLGFVRGFFSAACKDREEARRESAERFKFEWQRWVTRLAQAEADSAGTDFPAAGNVEPLRNALLGRPRGEIAALLGPPPATSAQPVTAKSTTYWYAETWYYPLDRPRHHAIAITFANDTVRSVEHLAGLR